MKEQTKYLDSVKDVRKALTWINSNNLQVFTSYYTQRLINVNIKVKGEIILIHYIIKSKCLYDSFYKPLRDIYY